jgi:type III secretory pathway component EscS
MRAVIEQAALLVAVLSLVPLVAVALVGGAGSLLQSVLQVQEQSTLHLLKLGTVAILSICCGEYACHEVQRLFEAVVAMAAHVGEAPK